VVRFGRWVDTSKSVRELGLPAPTPLQTTLKKACDWYVRHRYVRREDIRREDVRKETTAPSSQSRRDDGSKESAEARAQS
jgi:dTDP-D-glucose 4,6-dehydratase